MLMTGSRKKILGLYFENPRCILHLRGISRNAKVVPHSAHKYLHEFAKNKLLIKSEIPQLTFYKINPKNELLFKFFELFEIDRKLKFFSQNPSLAGLLTSFTKKLIHKTQKEVQMAILYGEAAHGDWKTGSPIDILAVTSKIADRSKITQTLNSIASRSGMTMKISFCLVTTDDIQHGIKKKRPFYNKLWKDRIVLYNEFLFWQLIKEAKFSVVSINPFVIYSSTEAERGFF